MENSNGGPLSPYRALDLTDGKGLLCGKLLGDLGADVIKVERPGGDPARKVGPFYHDEVDPEKSLFWWAFNTSKRGITLDIETPAGQDAFKRLVKTADFVIESFPPGYLDRLGLGYEALEAIDPGIIMVSISPFGQTGPYRDYSAPDIVAWAMGGAMYPRGDADRPPVRISHHAQSHLLASTEAAVGAMIALRHRQNTGQGQHVDVSIQASVVQVAFTVTTYWDMLKMNLRREQVAPIRMTRTWSCKDGYVLWSYSAGIMARNNLPFFEWMDAEGEGDSFIREFDWEHLDITTVTQETIDRLEAPVHRFFMKRAKAELFEGAVRHRIILYPVATTADILQSVQLAAREFWTRLEHPQVKAIVPYPGAFARASVTSPRVWRRAPLVGEHNRQVLEGDLKPRQEGWTPARQGTASSGGGPHLPASRRPLEGIRIADFTWNIVGPLATRSLCDYGATVIRLESKNRPDPARSSQRPFKDNIPGLNRSADFNYWSAGKLSVGLNLAHPRGVEIAKRFVAWADVVTETFAGGTIDRLGLGYGELKKVKPDIIMVSSCMHGHTGPHAAQPGYGHQLIALAGFSHLTGWPDREPQYIGPYTDYIACRFTALSILAALDYRHQTGQGQYIDMSQFENGIHFLAPLLLDYAANGRIANRMGNRSGDAAPHGAYRCQGDDRWCSIAVFTEEEWQGFCRVIGDPGWTREPKFSTFKARKENEDELDRHVKEWTINHSAEEVMMGMQAAGVAAGVLQNGEDLLERDPQLKHRNFFWELDHPEIGKHHVLGPSYTLSKAPCELTRAPLIGEHTEYALKEIIGLSDEEIAQLVIDGVLE